MSDVTIVRSGGWGTRKWAGWFDDRPDIWTYAWTRRHCSRRLTRLKPAQRHAARVDVTRTAGSNMPTTTIVGGCYRCEYTDITALGDSSVVRLVTAQCDSCRNGEPRHLPRAWASLMDA